jgi:hypothetical protein
MTHGDLLEAKELSPENSIVKKHRHPKKKGTAKKKRTERNFQRKGYSTPNSSEVE